MLTSRVDYCKGEPENFPTRAEIDEKFRKAACAVLDEKRMAQVISIVGSMEKLERFSSLTSLLRKN